MPYDHSKWVSFLARAPGREKKEAKHCSRTGRRRPGRTEPTFRHGRFFPQEKGPVKTNTGKLGHLLLPCCKCLGVRVYQVMLCLP